MEMMGASAANDLPNAALLQSYRSRFEGLAETERQKNELITELLQQNERLTTLLERFEDDLEREKNFARQSQREIKSLKIENNAAEEKLISYPYIQVLIDGDGMLFDLELIKRKKDGGSEAAERLLQEIRELVRIKGDKLRSMRDFDIRALVFANLDGLSKTLVKANLINPGDLQQFFIGFTQRLEHVNFIDVGYGKEMADSKIRGEFSFHMKDPRCRLILFGGSHDNGYAPFLKTCTATNPDCPIWLLEGPPAARDIVSMNLPSYSFHKIFSKESQNELTSIAAAAESPPLQSATLSPISNGTFNGHASMQTNGHSNGNGVGNGNSNGNGTMGAYHMPAAGHQFSYASAAVAPSPLTLARPSSIKYNSNSPTMEPAKTIVISGSGSTVNTGPATPRGIQHTMVASADAERVNYIKGLNPRACNNHYLRASCYNQQCSYSHKYKLNAEDIRTLRYIIERSKPCQAMKKRGFCEDEKCYYGHQCPFRTTTRGGAEKCSNNYCRFCQDDD
ncbi:hypothetical protein DRE_02174 [Drechslerella stenobrocha 248]|uniref:C3H1-type domain-containing protein n=1 Tax=Drechslerella stenobrocha 248 TaxID=1043628 RepID=W7IGQ9_9PEZI|nr:hypothetical protein DRE_02174 [Drechslerella stenobrocha 248]